MSDAKVDVPRSFYVFGVLALLWNLIGVAAYLADTMATAQTLASMPQAHQDFLAARPSWVIGVFAIAVFGGTLGCIMLLMRNALAVPLFAASLIAAVLQNIYSFALADGLAVFGTAGLALPAMIIIVASALLAYAQVNKKRGWI
ncbi:MAG: hypothetical protein AAF270_09275 [Pseudomonadota bacterium]